ncbi:UDP-N-acetylmuramate--L-alanine ligase [Ruminococcaceae bacterium OttesenSCG-928-D13]|nr:UDP-N-acetylmuramate--L-alanine ligase [Ruminococcaceae bacterium OttesenSCG-928-D13]
MPVDLNKILEQSRKIHFVGVGGSGMYPLVQILLAAGHTISGSDVNEGEILDYERRQGVRVMMGQVAENVHGGELVVYSAAIRADNPERLEAERLGIPCVERSVMLGYVASLYRRPLCIAGTHGKTTATGMAVQILEMGGHAPGAVIGGRLPLIGGYGQAGQGNDAMVVEACEYHNTFLELASECAVLLNVDDDHLEFFGSMENLKEAFRSFCRLATGAVLYNGDDANTREVVAPLLQSGVNSAGEKLSFFSFGLEEGADFGAINLREHRPGYWAFTLMAGGEAHGEIALGAPGKHNVYNALAAAAGAMRLGASFEDIERGLAAFSGTGRRFEVLGQVNGVTIADDYAHHPAEVKAVLTAAKAMEYGRVWAVHQPYTYSRTQSLLEDFAAVLPIADRVVLTAIMGGRERKEDYNVTTRDLADKIPGSVWFETQREAADYVLQNARPGDLVLTLGCGDIYKCAHMMLGDSTWG